MNLKCLHICCNYALSALYKNLVEEIDKVDICQVVYVPLRNHVSNGKNAPVFENQESTICYSELLELYHRINYKAKIKKIAADIQTRNLLPGVSIIHTHTWFSDGGAAYLLYKSHNIPYIVTVRNTDINIFFKYMIHLRRFGIEILTNASKIVFISPVYKERLFKKLKLEDGQLNDILNKSCVINNGIDDYWINNIIPKRQLTHKPLRLLYLGNFTTNKNVPRLIRAVNLLNSNAVSYELTIVGEKGGDTNRIMRLIENRKEFIFLGRITDKECLKNAFRNADIFTMPSKTETFGLVYIEALSQGLPIIYTRNEGVDGTVDKNAGEAVECNSIKSIASGIESIAQNYDRYQTNFDVGAFTWCNIALKYKNIYNHIVV